MTLLKKFALVALMLVFLTVGILHFTNMARMVDMIPVHWPLREAAVIVTGIVEILLAFGLLVTRFRRWAALGILILLVIYTPLHVIDVLRDTPVIGPKAVAIIRLPVQVVMLWFAWILWRDRRVTNAHQDH